MTLRQQQVSGQVNRGGFLSFSLCADIFLTVGAQDTVAGVVCGLVEGGGGVGRTMVTTNAVYNWALDEACY
jgi:hypothetical protein